MSRIDAPRSAEVGDLKMDRIDAARSAGGELK
jgi:hypothetical protein